MSSEGERRERGLAAASRRERQIMDIVYRLGAATAADVHREIENPPTYTTVRGLLRVLAEKGQLQIERDGARYVYRPTIPKSSAGENMLAHVVRTFFGGSPSRAMNALLGSPSIELTEAELQRLQRLVNEREADDRET
jgi:predicted transcriptional regulator